MSPKILPNLAQNSPECLFVASPFGRIFCCSEEFLVDSEEFLVDSGEFSFGRILGIIRENFGYYSGEFWALFGRILGIIRENSGCYSGEFWFGATWSLFGRAWLL